MLNTLFKFAFIKQYFDTRLGCTKLPLSYIKYGLTRTMSCASKPAGSKGGGGGLPRAPGSPLGVTCMRAPTLTLNPPPEPGPARKVVPTLGGRGDCEQPQKALCDFRVKHKNPPL